MDHDIDCHDELKLQIHLFLLFSNIIAKKNLGGKPEKVLCEAAERSKCQKQRQNAGLVWNQHKRKRTELSKQTRKPE